MLFRHDALGSWSFSMLVGGSATLLMQQVQELRLSGACVVGELDILRAHVAAWRRDANRWGFTVRKARKKFGYMNDDR